MEMFPASTKGGGQCLGTPDVCKVPTPGGPVPTPFPNMGMPNQASNDTCSTKVKMDGQPTIVKGTEIPMTSGDEAGSVGGVSSNKIKGKVEYKQGSSRVKAEGKEVCHLTSMTAQNDNNIPPGQQVAPSQNKVMVA
jgi:hypothetical protein